MNYSQKIYHSRSQLTEPNKLLQSMFNDLLAARQLAWKLMVRDINAKYRQTLLGYFWALIPPVVVAYGLVIAAQARVVNLGVTDLPYPAYVMLSMVLWQTFLEAFNAPLAAISESKTMLAKVNFPREAIILAKVGEVFFNFLIKLILVIFIFAVYDMPVSPMVFLAPLGVVQIVLLGTFLGLFIAPIGGIYQDFSRAIVIFTTPWLLITPVLYPMPKAGIFATIVKFNPVTSLLVTTRELATTGLVSNWSGFVIVSVISIIGLLLAWVFFRLAIPYVIERMPS